MSEINTDKKSNRGRKSYQKIAVKDNHETKMFDIIMPDGNVKSSFHRVKEAVLEAFAIKNNTTDAKLRVIRMKLPKPVATAVTTETTTAADNGNVTA
jgi:hypothetical protein